MLENGKERDLLSEARGLALALEYCDNENVAEIAEEIGNRIGAVLDANEERVHGAGC